MKRGRPAKAIYISQSEQVALCTSCPRPACRGTGDPFCPIRIASIAKHRRDADALRQQRQVYADRKARRGYWPEVHGEV